MKTFICSVCGYVHSGDEPPAQCPQCKAPREKFAEKSVASNAAFADEHKVGMHRFGRRMGFDRGELFVDANPLLRRLYAHGA